MDESVSKALIMVASVLLAMIVVGFITFSFGQMGIWATVQDDEVLTQQTTEFNREYEAYGKDLMYGVDVISCLNKALSNNDKIEDERMINGERYDANYLVDVLFTINSGLTETVRVYHMNANGSQEDYSGEGTDKPQKDLKEMKNIFTISAKYSSKIQGGTNKIDFAKNLNTYVDRTTKVNDDTYSLVQNSEIVEALLTCSDEVKQTVKNKSPNSSDIDSWTKAEWETALYDMKTRKFKCTNIEYSAETGRVNKIEFVEM